MPTTEPVAVNNLALDLGNYRTVKQPTEESATEAMISTSPDRFWALTDSLLRDGYLPTESIIVLRDDRGSLIVKEGNRRVAVLKLIHGTLPVDRLSIPDSILKQIQKVSDTWLENNKSVPCTIYGAPDAATVDRIVTLAHGKGEKAGRDQWNAVARARHNRDANHGSEPALDLLEKYLAQGRNVTSHQRARWAGNYPLSVLAEAMKRLAPRLGAGTSPGLASSYPAVNHRDAFEAILHAIGQEQLGFDTIRQKDADFTVSYGIPPTRSSTKASRTGKASTGTGGKAGGKQNTTSSAAGTAPRKPKAVAINDPKMVKRLLKEFEPRGNRREKVVTLRDEAIDLDLRKTPLAFSFVLRSMLEISAKAYCADHAKSKGPSMTKSGGKDKTLVEALRDITKHLTNNNTDRDMVKALHGAMTELGKTNGLLSVASMNQLVHNPRFSIAPSDIALLFGNVFPLLEAMNY